MVQVGTWKEDVMIRTCSQQDGKGICEETTANTTAELDRKHSNFTIIIDNMSVVSGSFKGKLPYSLCFVGN